MKTLNMRLICAGNGVPNLYAATLPLDYVKWEDHKPFSHANARKAAVPPETHCRANRCAAIRMPSLAFLWEAPARTVARARHEDGRGTMRQSGV